MAVARHFDGIDDALYIFPSFTTYTGWTWICRVKRDAVTATRNGLTGRFTAADNGWGVYVDASNLLTFQHNGILDTIPCPDLSDWLILAITFVQTSATSSTVKFYSGATPDTISLISTSSPTGIGAGSFAELGGGGTAIAIGHIQSFSLISTVAWNGSLDKYRLFDAELSLSQIQAVICNISSYPDHQKLIAEIEGIDPEPCIFNLFPDSLNVQGTTVITTSDVCDTRFLTGVEAVVEVGTVGTDVTEEAGQLVTCI